MIRVQLTGGIIGFQLSSYLVFEVTCEGVVNTDALVPRRDNCTVVLVAVQFISHLISPVDLSPWLSWLNLLLNRPQCLLA